MKRGIFVLILLLSINFVSAYGVSITHLNENEGSGSFDIKINSPDNIAGYQFYFEDNFYMTSMSGELTEDYLWDVASTSPSGPDAGHFLMAATFTPDENYIPAGSNTVTHITFDNWDGEEICFVEGVDITGDYIPDNNVVSDVDGDPILLYDWVCVYCTMPDGTPIGLGNINGDAFFNVQDIVLLAGCVLTSTCADLDYSCAADFNYDGNYNVLDIVALANCVLAQSCGG